MSQIHAKESSKGIWPFAHIPMYAVLGVKPVYIHDKGFKIRIYQFSHVYRDGLGNKRTKNGPRGLRSLQRGRGRPYNCDSPGVVKSAITHVKGIVGISEVIKLRK